jgi:hypothetical protein
MADPKLEFAIYPHSVAGTPHGLAMGPADDPDRIRAALQDLGGVAARTYLVDMEPGGEDAVLASAGRSREQGLLDHATLGCLRDKFDVDRWTELVRVGRHGDRLRSLQITNEPNLSFMDGSRPYVLEALIAGAIAAKNEARRRGMQIDVGFGSVPESETSIGSFWTDLGSASGSAFREAIDFVGHNFYVDVFEAPIEVGRIAERVGVILGDLRTRKLPSAGIAASVPIRVTETGGRPVRTSSPGRRVPPSSRRERSTHSCAPCIVASGTSQSRTTCCSDCATPTAPSPTCSTNSASCVTTTRRSRRTKRSGHSCRSSGGDLVGVASTGAPVTDVDRLQSQ